MSFLFYWNIFWLLSWSPVPPKGFFLSLGTFFLSLPKQQQPKERTNTPGCNLIKIGFSPKTWKKLEPGLPLLSFQTCFTQFSITFLSLLFHPLRLQLKRLFSKFRNRANLYLSPDGSARIFFLAPMPRRNKRWDGLSWDSSPRQSVELHQTGTSEGCSTDWATAPRLIETTLQERWSDLSMALFQHCSKKPYKMGRDGSTVVGAPACQSADWKITGSNPAGWWAFLLLLFLSTTL